MISVKRLVNTSLCLIGCFYYIMPPPKKRPKINLTTMTSLLNSEEVERTGWRGTVFSDKMSACACVHVCERVYGEGGQLRKLIADLC